MAVALEPHDFRSENAGVVDLLAEAFGILFGFACFTFAPGGLNLFRRWHVVAVLFGAHGLSLTQPAIRLKLWPRAAGLRMTARDSE